MDKINTQLLINNKNIYTHCQKCYVLYCTKIRGMFTFYNENKILICVIDDPQAALRAEFNLYMPTRYLRICCRV